MTDGRGAAVVLFVACLLVAAVAPPVVAGNMAAAGVELTDNGSGVESVDRDVESADGSGNVKSIDGPGDVESTDGSDNVESTDGSGNVESTDGSGNVESTDDGHHEAIAPALRSASGPTEIVVRFEGDAGIRPNEAGGPGASGDVSTADLKADAVNAQANFERFAEGHPGVSVERRFWLANAMLVVVDTDRVPIDRLLEVRGVERVHDNFEVGLNSASTAGGGAAAVAFGGPDPTASGATTDTVSTTSAGTKATYGVDMVRAPEVWETFGTRGEGATVAVIDTGIDPDHPDLAVSGWAEYDADGHLVSNSVSDASDGHGHGTHVAGTVAGGNASGTAIGVSPDAALYGIRVFDDDGGNGTFPRVIAGMEHAVESDDIDILQMSLGASGYESELIEPVRNARDAEKIVVAASGNSGEGSSSTPGNVYDSLSVGAVDETRDVAEFSSGERITTNSTWENDAPEDWPDEYVVPDVSAPGVDVNSSIPDSKYLKLDGTSMAAPHVSGVAALVLSATSRDVSADELYETIRMTTNHPENNSTADTRYGTGIVDAYAAVSSTAPFYNVSYLDTPAAVEKGGQLNATATVTNRDQIPGDNRTVELRLTDPANTSNVTTLASQNVSLGPGNATTVSLNGTVPSEFGTGETVVTIASPEDDASAAIRIAEDVGTINGTVTDAETDATLADIDVVVENGTEVVGTTVTGPAGTYAIDVPATNLTVTASNATYAPANQTVELSGSGDTATANVSLALRDGTLSGVVTASDGLERPSNASVTVTNETDATVATIDVDEDGTYTLDLRPDAYDVAADAPDFEPLTRADVTVEPNATTDPGLELDPRPASLFGTVTNESDGEAIADAAITVDGVQRNTTDANGTYAVNDLDRGQREVTVSADGYTRESRPLTLTANDIRELNVSLSPRGVFTITDLSAPDDIEQGSSGEFDVTVRNDGRVTDDAVVDITLDKSGSVSPSSVALDGIAVGSHGSGSVTVSIGSSASTGTYTVTASTADNSQPASFEVVNSESDDDGADTGGSSGDGAGGGGGGGGGGAQTQPPAEDTEDGESGDDAEEELTNETDDVVDDEELVDDETEEEADDGGAPEDSDGNEDSNDGSDDDSRADDEAASEADDAQPDDATDDSAPGFGVAAGVVALLAGILWARRVETPK